MVYLQSESIGPRCGNLTGSSVTLNAAAVTLGGTITASNATGQITIANAGGDLAVGGTGGTFSTTNTAANAIHYNAGGTFNYTNTGASYGGSVRIDAPTIAVSGSLNVGSHKASLVGAGGLTVGAGNTGSITSTNSAADAISFSDSSLVSYSTSNTGLLNGNVTVSGDTITTSTSLRAMEQEKPWRSLRLTVWY